MCGIYGAVAFRGAPLRRSEQVEAAGRMLRHRGPDAHGICRNSEAALGCERLRIVDMSEAGDQPLTDPGDRLWAVVNGEIYNAPELRARYSDYPFKSGSDAETVLPLYMHRGPSGVAELEGMFAVAIYDARKHGLVLARDRAGEKPLFYCRVDGEIWFASEIQSLLGSPGLRKDLDDSAVRDFVTLGYVAEPRTMFRDIRKVRAGTVLSFAETGTEKELTYWSPGEAMQAPSTVNDAADQLESLLVRAVKKQLCADVPVGVFTSGGVDSSLLAAMASEISGSDSLSTFSVGFVEPEFDESRYAKRLAAHVCSRHYSVTVDHTALQDALATVTSKIAEPIADPAILPTLVLAETAGEHVKVVLGGEGADELFAGYPTYLGHSVAPLFMKLPRGLRRLLERGATALHDAPERKVSPEYLLKRFVAGAGLPTEDRHSSWFGTGAGIEMLNPDIVSDEYAAPVFPLQGDAISRACTFDFSTYLRDNLLTKVDRATMLASIEARAPYLDRDVAEFALALDSRFKVRGWQTKWLLKQVARRWLPAELVRRRKRGLSVPVATWINAGLRSEVERHLSKRKLETQGLLHPKNVDQLLRDHQSGRVNNGRAVWALLMLQHWLENWVPERY